MDPLMRYDRQWVKTTWNGLTAFTPMERTRKAVRLERIAPGGPFVHMWHYPNGARSHLNVRIDADWCKREEWERTMRMLAPIRKHASWFVTAGAIADADLDLFETLKRSGVEIGSHMFHHYTFADEPNNMRNMERAHEWLARHGVECRSFVSPSAKWNPGLQRCVERMGYAYSSEFGLAHDCLPFRTPGGGLQVPVHAVCPNNFVSKERIGEYYVHIAEELLKACLPIHLYFHPHDIGFIGGGIIETIAALPDVHVSTLLEYAEWWKNRRCDFAVVKKDDEWSVEWSGSEGVRLAVSWDGAHYSLLSEPAVTFAHGTLPPGKEITCEPFDAPSREVIRQTLNWRSKIGSWFDTEYVVPASEYRVSSPKTLLNYLLKLRRG